MSEKKHMIKSKSKIKYVLVIALFVIVALIIKNMYGIQVATIKNVSKEKYLLAPNEVSAKSVGNVTITYKDTEGNEIASSEQKSGNIGEEYTTSRKAIEGYRAHGNDPINKIGNFDNLDIVVNYVYETCEDEVKTLTDGKIVTVQVEKNKEVINKEIKFSIITEDELGNKISGAKYIVTGVNSDVIRNATSYSEKLVVGSLTINKEGKDTYAIKELSAPKGYENIATDIKVNITKTHDADNNTFAVSANVEETSDAQISMNEDSNEIIVIVKNKKQDEEELPKEEPKIFDLEINKSISEVKLNIGDNVITKEVEKGKLLKIDIPRSKINGSSIEVTYELEVKNVGQIAGYATEISDMIPDGMELAEDPNWSSENGIAISNVFEKTLLNPGDSVTTTVTFNWNLQEDNIGLKTNKAIISGYYNDEGIEDNTPDNESEESMLVTVKTGGKVLITVEVVILLCIVSGIVFIVKKRNK